MAMPKYNADIDVKFFDDSSTWDNCLGKILANTMGIKWSDLDDVDQISDEDDMTQKRRVQYRYGEQGDGIVVFIVNNAKATGTDSPTGDSHNLAIA